MAFLYTHLEAQFQFQKESNEVILLGLRLLFVLAQECSSEELERYVYVLTSLAVQHQIPSDTPTHIHEGVWAYEVMKVFNYYRYYEAV